MRNEFKIGNVTIRRTFQGFYWTPSVRMANNGRRSIYIFNLCIEWWEDWSV